MIRRNSSDAPVQYDRQWTEVTEWNGFEKGELVHVTGTHGCEFRFMYAHERDGEVVEVTVHGGDRGHASYRTFAAGRVVKPTAAKRRRTRSEMVRA